jgi:hypothetical protein
MNSCNWRDGEIRKMLTIMGEKVMQSHLKMTKDGRSKRKYLPNFPYNASSAKWSAK